MRRLSAYVAGSTALASLVTAYAFYDRPNFYSAAVYLSQSSACLIILSNVALVYFAGLMYGLQRLLFGPLRRVEIEQLWERGWIAGTEWLFALSIFREDFGVAYLATFILLFVSKVWGWMVDGRLDILEQQNPQNATKFHTRLVTATVVNFLLPLRMASYCFEEALYGPRLGIMTMFTFEFGILLISSISTAIKYALWAYEYRLIQKQMKERLEELRREAVEAGETPPAEGDMDIHDLDLPGWEAKSSFQFALDIGTDFLKFGAYLAFFSVLTFLYGLPIYIIRDLYMSARSFFSRINDYRQYRTATRNMHNQYPDATAEQLTADNICIVCREDMKPWIGTLPADEQAAARNSGNYAITEKQRPKRLPCGHTLHFSCLRSWLERQQTCPTCRRSVLRPATQPSSAPPARANGAPPAPGVVNPVPQAPAPAPGARRPAPAPPQGIDLNRVARRQGWVFRFGPARFWMGRMDRGNRRIGWGFRLGPLRFFVGRLEEEQARRLLQGWNNEEVDEVDGFLMNPPGLQQPLAQRARPPAIGVEQPDESSSQQANANQASGTRERTPQENLSSAIQSHALHAHLTAIEQVLSNEVRLLHLAGYRIQTIQWLISELERARLESQANRVLLLPGSEGAAGLNPTGAFATPQTSGNQVILDSEGNPLITLPQGWAALPLQSYQNNEESSNAPANAPESITIANQPSVSTAVPSLNVLNPTPTRTVPPLNLGSTSQPRNPSPLAEATSNIPSSSQADATTTPGDEPTAFQLPALRTVEDINRAIQDIQAAAPSLAADVNLAPQDSQAGTTTYVPLSSEQSATPDSAQHSVSGTNGTSTLPGSSWSFSNLPDTATASSSAAAPAESSAQPQPSSSATGSSGDLSERKTKAQQQPTVEDLEDEDVD